jgi:hypothetical protein
VFQPINSIDIMKTPEWPEPKRDTSGYLFLYPFYDRGEGILQDSPEHSKETNLRRIDRVAVRALAKFAQFSRVYEGDVLPARNLEDPCGLLPSLPVEMSRFVSHNARHICLSLLPVLSRGTPGSASWLGVMEIAKLEGEDAQLHKVRLNQPGAGAGVELPRHSLPYVEPIESFATNLQVMNFMNMVDGYLDALEQNRLVVASA